ncbi:hypothetical protein KIW84_035509 [Lathyrus oleraceus]|uniref:Uncharacterized protein n=1 Tax=Pisum sativum TaxID=3888 RepID=A0A9D4Y2D9_PEA|nr:hypothetical protein KIW84_035509 [Pisum sativum]
MENIGNIDPLISQDSAYQLAPGMEERFNSLLNGLTPSKEIVEIPNDETINKMDTCDNIEALAETKKVKLKNGISFKLSNGYTTLLDEIEPDEEGEILTSGINSIFEDGE